MSILAGQKLKPADGDQSGCAEVPLTASEASRTPLGNCPELYERVLDSMTEGVSICDEAGIILYTNPAENTMFGYAPGELLGQHVSIQNAYSAEENEHRVAAVIEQLKTVGAWTGEWLNRRKDGTVFRTFARILRVENGQKRYFVCVQANTTARKTAEDDQRSAAELADFVENATVGMHWVAADGTIVWANRSELDLLGYAETEYIGHNVAEFHINRVAAEDILSRLRAGEALRNHPAQLRAKDGTTRHVLIDSSVYWKDGEFVHTQCITRDVTDAKTAEEARIRLSAIVESSDDAIIAKDLDGTIRTWNRGAERIFGYTADEVIGRNVSMLAAPHVVYEIPKILARIAQGEQVDHYETQRRRKDGEIITVSLSVSPLRDAHGAIIGASKIARDVTERKTAEHALREMERHLMLLMDASSALLASPKAGEVVTSIVRLAERFVSADAHALWRKDSTGTWHIQSSSGLSDEYVRAGTVSHPQSERLLYAPAVVEDIAAEPALEDRYEALSREGVRSMLVIPLNIEGQATGTVVFYWREQHSFSDREVRVASALGNLATSALRTADLYEHQRQLRADAEASEQRAAFLADAGAVLASSLNYQATLSSVAKLAVPRFADWAAVDVVADGQVHRVAVQHPDPEKLRRLEEFTKRYPPHEFRLHRTVLETGKSVLAEQISPEILNEASGDAEHLRILHEMGLRSLIIAPMVLNAQSLGTITFVTAESGRQYTPADLQTAEELARRAAVALEHARVFAQSKAAQIALQRSNVELRTANADLEQFAYSASHDLQEPLRMLAVYSQLLERKYKEQLSGDAKDYLRYIVDGARRMEWLLRDLLAYTQVIGVAENEEVPSADARAAMEQVLFNLRAAILDSDARITYGQLPQLLMKEVHLVQLLQNLIGNAIKYRGEHPPVVDVNASEEGSVWRICVRDNGIGIDPLFADHIFGIFKRLHRNDQYSGTGIGLAICQKIVHRYGGRIWVESGGEGTGSTFCFTAPRAD